MSDPSPEVLSRLAGAIEEAGPGGAVHALGFAWERRFSSQLARRLGSRIRLVVVAEPALPPGGLWLGIARELVSDGTGDARRQARRAIAEGVRANRDTLVVVPGAELLPAESLASLLGTAEGEPGLRLLLFDRGDAGLAAPLPTSAIVTSPPAMLASARVPAQPLPPGPEPEQPAVADSPPVPAADDREPVPAPIEAKPKREPVPAPVPLRVPVPRAVEPPQRAPTPATPGPEQAAAAATPPVRRVIPFRKIAPAAFAVGIVAGLVWWGASSSPPSVAAAREPESLGRLPAAVSLPDVAAAPPPAEPAGTERAPEPDMFSPEPEVFARLEATEPVEPEAPIAAPVSPEAEDIVPLSAPINVSAQPWARIEIDGRVIGETPIGELRLPYGTHDVRAVFADGASRTRQVRADDNERFISFER